MREIIHRLRIWWATSRIEKSVLSFDREVERLNGAAHHLSLAIVEKNAKILAHQAAIHAEVEASTVLEIARGRANRVKRNLQQLVA